MNYITRWPLPNLVKSAAQMPSVKAREILSAGVQQDNALARPGAGRNNNSYQLPEIFVKTTHTHTHRGRTAVERVDQVATICQWQLWHCVVVLDIFIWLCGGRHAEHLVTFICCY